MSVGYIPRASVCLSTAHLTFRAPLGVCLWALIRYVGVVPADRAFYDAGMAAKAAGQLGNAFVFLNRYLDLREAMEVRVIDRHTLPPSSFLGSSFHAPLRSFGEGVRSNEFNMPS